MPSDLARMKADDIAILEAGLEAQARKINEASLAEREVPPETGTSSVPPHIEAALTQSGQTSGPTSAQRLASMGVTVESNH